MPVLCLGEIAALRNFFDWPAMQQWSYKAIGFPIPYLVVGRWGLTPFPRQTGLKFIVGEPLQPPYHQHGTQVSARDAHGVAMQCIQGFYLHRFPAPSNQAPAFTTEF